MDAGKTTLTLDRSTRNRLNEFKHRERARSLEAALKLALDRADA